MLRLLHLLVLATLVLAAADVYKIKFDSTVQAERLAKLRAEIRRERDAIAALRAEWTELDRPERLQGLAKRHLTLKPVEISQIDSLDRLPERPPENVPDRRVRSALGLRGLRYLEGLDGSLRLDYRLYFDDWGMWSHTVELGLRAPLGERWLGELVSRSNYQTSVWFWQRAYVVAGAGTIPDWRTVDKELSSQLAETLTARAAWRLGRVTVDGELSATYDRFFDYMFLDSRTALVALLGLRYDL